MIWLVGDRWERSRNIYTLQLHKYVPKRRLGVLENLYSGTSKRFATAFPSVLQKSPVVISLVAHKNFKNPFGKGLEAHLTAFSMQH
jgi:hypothetical protein